MPAIQPPGKNESPEMKAIDQLLEQYYNDRMALFPLESNHQRRQPVQTTGCL
jgi:hypothetical protein